MAKKQKDGELVKLGKDLFEIDRLIVMLMAIRGRVAVEVALYKKRTNQPLLRKKIERQRRALWMKWAREEGVDPEDARTLFNVILAQMCRIEIAALQSGKR